MNTIPKSLLHEVVPMPKIFMFASRFEHSNDYMRYLQRVAGSPLKWSHVRDRYYLRGTRDFLFIELLSAKCIMNYCEVIDEVNLRKRMGNVTHIRVRW